MIREHKTQTKKIMDFMRDEMLYNFNIKDWKGLLFAKIYIGTFKIFKNKTFPQDDIFILKTTNHPILV